MVNARQETGDSAAPSVFPQLKQGRSTDAGPAGGADDGPVTLLHIAEGLIGALVVCIGLYYAVEAGRASARPPDEPVEQPPTRAETRAETRSRRRRKRLS